MVAKIFIDGEAGTTGLQIRERLAPRRDLELVSIDPARRKDPEARAELLNNVDVAILCLPDEGAREAVSLIDNPDVRIIDPSTAHRVAPGWEYGFPEIGNRDAIMASKRVTNPGCWSTGAIGLLKPLVESEIIPAGWPVTINGVSGYSGGGKSMIAEFEDPGSAQFTGVPYRLYALTQTHKHLPEIQARTGLTNAPLFAPAVGRYFKGMLVEIPLPLWALPGSPKLSTVQEVLADEYAGERFVTVATPGEAAALKTLDPEGLNDTNEMRLFAFGNEAKGEARLVALLDNLGKGASGACVQNLNLMLGFDEGEGL
jgi:N-acetyl-gamma-glutamyl-phosphate reductase